MLSVKKVVLLSLVKSILVLSAALFATANLADDNQQVLQLAQLSEGFNAAQKNKLDMQKN